jgi:hypothetical protein
MGGEHRAKDGRYIHEENLFSYLSVYLFDNGGETAEGEPMTVGPGDDCGAQLDDDPLGGGKLVPVQERRLPTLLLQAQRGAVALVYRVETPVVTQKKDTVYITKRIKPSTCYLKKGQQSEMVLLPLYRI